MQLAAQLAAAGLDCFPCAVSFDSGKNRWDKWPLTVKGESWADTAKRPIDDPAVRWPGCTVLGLPVPPGVIILDADWYKDGASKTAAEQSFGCSIPWAEALIQTTIGGGEHYAFRAPGWPARQYSNVAGPGIDTRVAGKGFICTGEGYTPHGMGCFRLIYPESLPVLPEGCRPALEAVAPAPPTRTTTDTTEVDLVALAEALAHVDPGCDRTAWIKIAMALRHAFRDDEATGYAIFDKWSAGEYWPAGCPDNYVADVMVHQWSSLKPDGGTGTGSLYWEAMRGGWIPPATFDTALAFGEDAAGPDVFNSLVALINESGTDISKTEQIIAEVVEGRCNALQRDLLTLSLKAALKGAKLLDGALSKRLDNLLRPDCVPRLPPVPASLPEVIDIKDLPVAPLSRPSGLHGVNAELMKTEIFADRIAMRYGELRWWSGREWQPVPVEIVRRITYLALMPDQCKNPNVEGTRAALLALTDPLPDPVRGPLMFFDDCILDVVTGAVTPHCPTNYNTSCLHVSRTESTDAPQWFNFLDQIFGGIEDGPDRVALLQEVMGWAMLQDDLNVQKLVAFDGASRAGKGLILEVLQAIMGGDKSGVITFANIDDGKTQSAFRKHDVVMDLEAKPPANQSLKPAIGFMNKVASNEAVSIQLLNTQDPWTGRLNCKMLIACNGIPALLDDSGATTNRFIVLYFTRSFKEKEDHKLLSRLVPEKANIAAWAVQGAHRLATNGGVFTKPATSSEALTEMRQTNQPLSDFIDQYLEFDIGERCHGAGCWEAYRLYASKDNIKLCTANAFYRSFKRSLMEYPCEYKKQIRVEGVVSAGYEGFKVRDLTIGAVAFKPTLVGQ